MCAAILTVCHGAMLNHMNDLKLYLVLALTGLVVIFTLQNVVVVDIRFLFWSFSMSRALVIFFTLAIGVVIGWVLRGYLARKSEREARSASRPGR